MRVGGWMNTWRRTDRRVSPQHTTHPPALMYKQNFEEILESVQAQILQHFEVGEEELEAATEAFKDDPEVAALVAELEGLYLGASAGVCGWGCVWGWWAG